ncbi:MAG: hypothetical protein K8L99_24880, partial [Anaerolineae bacterium]|nr:hypothetical protein [Anaerolineae bacterium]
MVVVRHSYIGRRGSGGQAKAIGKALAHVKYIEHRPGPDREEGGREIFSDTEDRVKGYEVRKEIREIGNQRVTVHKLTLAPEINPEDKKAFTREVMSELGRTKGHDLKWYAVEHNNTDHHHVHVVVMGKDRHGIDVKIDLKDINKIKEYGDRYLEREHPRELERAREERERQKDARRREWEKAREQRERGGLELPWMHKKIIREQLEPYEKWREKQDEKEKEKDRAREEHKLEKSRDKIEAMGKEWSKANSLKELRGLNERLWDNFDERISKADYKKLGSWITDKEREVERRQIEKELEKQQEGKEARDYFEYEGERYNKKDPYKKLSGLAQELRQKDEKLPYDDYQKLRGWIEDRDRNRWQGALEKGLSQAKREMRTPERPRTTEVAGGQMIDPLQEHMMRNPVVGLFMIQAGLANELVRSIELTDKRDLLKENREEIEKGLKELSEKDRD